MVLLKKTDKLITKVNNIGTSDFVLKKTDYNTKITEIEGKIPDICNLTTKTALTTAENKIPNVSNLVNKTDCNTKVTEIENKVNKHNHGKYITTPEFNKLAADIFNAKIAQANLITKTDFDAKLSSLNRKIIQNKSKHLLVENELKKLKTFDSSYFIDKSHFEEDGNQNYLVIQPIIRYFKTIIDVGYVSPCRSKGLSAESVKPPTTFDNRLTPTLNSYGNNVRVKFAGSCLKQPKISHTHEKVVKIYIVFELGASSSYNNDPH